MRLVALVAMFTCLGFLFGCDLSNKALNVRSILALVFWGWCMLAFFHVRHASHDRQSCAMT